MANTPSKHGNSASDTPPPRPRLSRPHHRLRERYDVVVVGSGYGGAIAASRLARAGRSVCLLERGRELLPGDFPRTMVEAAGQLQVRKAARRLGRATGLFDLRAGHDLSVLVGCGLGGTSLINAGVALRPPKRIYDDDRWPTALRGQDTGPAELAPYFSAAERMLGSSPYPDDWPEPTKLTALATAAGGVGATVLRPRINVTFTDGPNAAGVEQRACTLCGDCVTGCNHGAKNTVNVNYLPDAVAHGAEVYCEAEVRTVLPAGGDEGGWVVSFGVLAGGRRRFDAPTSFVFADVVVLAAGTLGSTEILLRSRDEGLPTSSQVGRRFSGNGDVLAFAYDVKETEVRGIGVGRRQVTAQNAVGPCITGMIDLTEVDTPSRVALIEEGAIPGALRALMPAAFAVAADIHDGGSPADFAGRLVRRVRATRGAVLDPTGGPADRSLTYLVMSDDAGDGELRLEDGELRVEWPAVGDLPVFDNDAALLRSASEALGAEFVGNPVWSPMLHESLLTVHPLGGCAMADDGARGAVDDRGRVFSGDGTDVHDGLLVADGAIVPRPLAVNPLLTISALAERACALLAAERGWSVSTDATPALPVPPLEKTPGVRFTERMAGWAAITDQGDTVEATTAGAERGLAEGTRLEFVLTIEIDDLPALLADPSTPGRLSGTVIAPSVSPRRLRVLDGSFRLVQEDPTHVDTWNMRYELLLVADDGRRFSFEGYKVLTDLAFALDAWNDTTTLYSTLRDEHGRVVAAGVLRITPSDFARQLTTMRITGVEGAASRAMWLARFGRRFARSLLTVYGGPLRDVAAFPETPARPVPLTGAGHRRLRLPAPEPRWCDGSGRWHEGTDHGDDAWLRLVRYEGGRRGPVLLAAGFGMSATSFLVDTVETNLAEHLVERGYDVWLFDYRASIDLPSSHTQFTLDDIARTDWPAAVAEVRRVTGAAGVQAVGHCVGSVSLLMALGAGLGGVRSAVAMQFPLHPATSYLNQVKSALKVDRALKWLGQHKVSPLTRVDVPNTALDLALRVVPMPMSERCDKALCRWINAIYGCTHTHAQLNDATHEQLDDMFGVGNLASFAHLGLIMQRRLAVDGAGRAAYTSHPERMRLPILLVQGEENYIFHPEGSSRTLRWLQNANDPTLYERAVLPGYAHLDALIGRDAATDVFPRISEHLDRFNR
ncbi:MAG TPA: GMC family oxidoreductase N-terminal domain-containing protein [Acidimicrobiales bacterium]|nr:GMC family oxidoreductase N-terminal domain-containing protein [Acidimicrobiales bacterium]